MSIDTTTKYVGSTDATLDPVYAALRSTAVLAWRHLDAIVAISIGWVLCSLPVVTIGPATVGSYYAVASLREQGQVDREKLLGTVRDQLPYALLLGLAPVVLFGIMSAYAQAYLSTGASASLGLTVVCLIATAYILLVSVPTYIGLAQGDDPIEALKEGIIWTANHTVRASVLATLTVILFACLAITTIGIGLLFAGLTFVLHTELVTATWNHSTRTNGQNVSEPTEATDNCRPIQQNVDIDRQTETK